MTGFVHLVCHSYYSFMRGVSSLDELCRAAKERGMDALALTDLNGLYGAVFFWQAAIEHGIKPIIGADVQTDTERAVLLAKNSGGYARLSQILIGRHNDDDFSLSKALTDNSDGLIVLSNDIPLLKALISGNSTRDVYVSLPPGVNSLQLIQFTKEHEMKPAAVGDVYFAHRQQHQLHRLLRAIDLNTTLSRIAKVELADERAWLTPADKMTDRFPHCQEALRNAAAIAEECVMTEPPWKELLFPTFDGLGPDEAFGLLKEKCYAGAKERYGGITDAAKNRLEYELEIIRNKGFVNYFLVVADIVSRFPLTCGRGSAAASIVSYCLKITHVEPLRHNLFFERFLNPGRVDQPDIDVDFPWDERDNAIDYVFEKYGDHNAAMVANHVSLQARAAVREVAKVYGLPEGEINRVTKKIPCFHHATNTEELVRNHPRFKDIQLAPPWPEILKLAAAVEGIPRHISVHCGGVVIAPGKLKNRVPFQKTPRGVNVIQWEKDQTEDGGLVKIDLLGNRSLAVIRDALKAIEKNYAKRIFYCDLNPLDDPMTQALLARGDTIGVFYVESPAMRQLQKKTRKGDFEHLVIHSSIIRPAANDFIREYVRRLHGGSYEPLHPMLDEILAETFGIMCYQEDVCKTAMIMGGFNAVEGDGLRKVLSKKHRYKKLAEYKEMFYRGASERDVKREVIDKIWEMILSFSGYSFCKPHSASYALVSFKSAWLRAHYPAEFMAAVISNRGGYYSAFAYISEARRMGLEVLPPDINESEEHYTGINAVLRVGLMQIKGFSKTSMETVLEKRKQGSYASFDDFMRRAAIAPSDARLLVKAGCFDSIEKHNSRPALLWMLEKHEHCKPRRMYNSSLSLFDAYNLDSQFTGLIPNPQNYDEKTMLRHEVETLGFLISRHPLTLYQSLLKPRSYVPANELEKWIGKRITTIGWYVTGKLVETKHGEPMEFFSFEDTTAIYETTFFPDAYRQFCYMIGRERPYRLQGRVEEDYGVPTLNVDRVNFLPSPTP